MVEVLNYINQNLRNKIYMKDMAALVGYSPGYFCEKFKEYTGENFKEYVQRRQMQFAMKAILEGKSTLDIALGMGYESRWGFTRAFVREFGITPSQFKRENQRFFSQYEKNKLETRMLSNRCELLRKRVVEIGSNLAIHGQRMYYFVKGYYDVPLEKRSNLSLMSASLSSVIRNAQPLIEASERIVGYNYDGGYYYPEVDKLYIKRPEDRSMLISYLSGSILTEMQKTELIDRLTSAADKFNPEYTNNLHTLGFQMPELSQEEEGSVLDHAALGCCQVNHHALISYEKVLHMGFDGLAKWVCEHRRRNGHGAEEFYESMLLVCKAASEFGERYAKEAEHMLDRETDPDKQKDLALIRENCLRVPRYPAETFFQAVQCIWFVTIFNTWEDGINGNSLGRLDQLLYPYYKKDVTSGSLTREEALELVCMLMLKLYSKDNNQMVVIGGCDENGNSSVNELSYMFLDAVEALNIVCCLAVRYSPRVTEHAFLQRAFEVLGHTQKGIPVFFNDDVVISSLTKHGILYTDACRYAVVGCVEIAIPGKSNQHSATGQCNLLKALEYAMNNGESMCSSGTQCGPCTGEAESFTTFTMLLDAVKLQLKHIIDTTCKIINHNIPVAAAMSPVPLKSLLTDDCVTAGKDYNAGGPVYNYYQVMLLGFPNLVDSLAAIRTIVYEQHMCTLQYVANQMRSNFPDEKLRKSFLNKAPKYGNNTEEVNLLASELFNKICDMVYDNHSLIGQGFHAQLYTYIWNSDFGRNTAATPDGRHKGDALAASISPVQGSDVNGLTALLYSLAALPNEKAPGTAAAVIDAEPYLFCDQYINKFLDTFIASSKSGLSYVQFNLADRETLSKAKMRPKHYEDLVVSVSGFSKRFVDLDETIKDQVIARTKHTTL